MLAGDFERALLRHNVVRDVMPPRLQPKACELTSSGWRFVPPLTSRECSEVKNFTRLVPPWIVKKSLSRRTSSCRLLRFESEETSAGNAGPAT